MLSGFEFLESSEMAALLDAPVAIAALIGAADGKFDQQESEWSDRLVDVFTYNKPKALNDFYAQVSLNFIEKVNQKLAGLPGDTKAKTEALGRQLEALNPILAQLDQAAGAALYSSFIKLARETAKASGGFLRIGAIAAAEQRWIDLPMLTPIHAPAANVAETEEE